MEADRHRVRHQRKMASQRAPHNHSNNCISDPANVVAHAYSLSIKNKPPNSNTLTKHLDPDFRNNTELINFDDAILTLHPQRTVVMQ